MTKYSTLEQVKIRLEQFHIDFSVFLHSIFYFLRVCMFNVFRIVTQAKKAEKDGKNDRNAAYNNWYDIHIYRLS